MKKSHVCLCVGSEEQLKGLEDEQKQLINTIDEKFFKGLDSSWWLTTPKATRKNVALALGGISRIGSLYQK